MGNCDWCGKDRDLSYVSTDGGRFFLCKDCKNKLANSICRKCGDSYDIGIRGMCLACAQVDTAKAERLRTERNLGVDYESLDDITTDKELTEEEYNNWVTFGQGNFSPATRKENRRKWIISKLLSDNYDEKTIKENLEDIEELLDINFNAILNNKINIIIDTNNNKITKSKIGNIIGKLNKVYLVGVRE